MRVLPLMSPELIVRAPVVSTGKAMRAIMRAVISREVTRESRREFRLPFEGLLDLSKNCSENDPPPKFFHQEWCVQW